jgi:CheY-like chemotaxis protein
MLKTPVKTVLVVEDDKATRGAMVQLLRHHGFSVQSAGTVAEAMTRITSYPDYILLDLMLPDGNGGEILEWLRDNAPDTPVSVLTGCGDAHVLDLVEKLGPTALLQKPIDFMEILQRLNDATAA